MLPETKTGGKTTVLEILKTSVPAVIDLSSQTFIWAYEAALVGQLGASALAGIGLAGQLIIVTFTILLTFVVGSSLIINRYLGKKDNWEANHILGQALFLALLISFLIGAVWYSGAPLFFKVIKETGDISSRSYGIGYLQFLAFFTPILVAYFLLLGILRSTGDTKYSMMINLTSNSLNFVLAPLFIFGRLGFPRLEVKGAAVATVICHSLGLILTIIVLRSRKTRLYLSFKEFTSPKWESVKLLFKTGFPTTVEQLTWAAGQLIVMSFVGRLGEIAIATHTILLRIQAVLSMLYTGFSLGSMALVGQNIGADDHHKAERTGYLAGGTILTIIIIVTLIMYVLTPAIWDLFTNDREIIGLGVVVMNVFLLAQIPKAISSVLTGNLRGVGELKWLMWIMIVFVSIYEIGFTWTALFVMQYTLASVWFIHGIDELTRMSIYFLKFKGGKWKLKNT